jgi:hypothetical protein
MLLLKPGLGHATCAASRRHGRSKASRGGAIQPSAPPSKSFPLPFHIRQATISSERIVHESVTFYKIVVSGIGNCSWDVFRRFSDFQQLFEKMSITSFEIKVKFPPRHWFSFFIALTEEEEDERQRTLEQWFAAVMTIANGDCRPNGASTFDVNQIKSCLNDFLDMKENFATALKNTEEDDIAVQDEV